MFRRVFVFCMFVSVLIMPAFVLAAGGTGDSGTLNPQIEVLTLDRCLDMALKNSQQVIIAAKNVEKAREGVKQAQAGFLLTVDYQAGFTKFSENQLIGWPGGRPLYGHDQGFGASISATQPLYTAGKLQNAVKLAQIQLNSALEDERKAKQQLVYSVKEAYFQVWVAEKMLAVANDAVSNLDRHVDQIQKFKQVGTASKYDLNRAEVQRDSLKPNVIKAENGVALAKLGLATLIGFDKDREFSVMFDPAQRQLPDKIDNALSALLEEAYQKRSELHQISQYKEVTQIKTALAEAQYKPNIVLMGTYEGKDPNGGDLNIGNWKTDLTLTLALKGNLYNAGATKAQVDAAKKDQEIAEAQESGLKDKIRLEVQQAMQSMKENLATIRANQSNMGLAKDTLKNTQARFDAGLATTMDIMDSELALDQALNGYYSGVANYRIAEARLDMVVGRDIK